MNNTIGTCSICGGPVTLPEMWGGTVPPIPRCDKCGARAKQPYGPRIEMEPITIGHSPELQEFMDKKGRP